MEDKEETRVQLLASEVMEVLGTILRRREPLDPETLAQGLLERPGVASLLAEAAASESVPEAVFEETEVKLKDLTSKYHATLEDLRQAEIQTQELEEAFKQLTLILAGLAEMRDQPRLNHELKLLKEGLKHKAIPGRLSAATKVLKDLLFKLDLGVAEEVVPEAPAAEAGPESIEDNVRDILSVLVKDITAFEAPELREKAQVLARKIGSEFTLDNYEPYVGEINELIFELKEIVRRDREELYRFTQEVMARLEETEKDFLRTIDSNRERLQSAEVAFQERVAGEIREIEESFQVRGQTLEQIRSLVLEKIASIRERFRKKRAEDEARLRQAEADKARVERRLTDIHRRHKEFARQSKAMLEEMEKFRQASLRDGLTKVYNRRAYDLQIRKALAELAGGGLTCFSLIVFDIDYFRDFNNRYGHRAGDKILLHVARLARENLRQEDFLARYGGDEFVVILPEVSLQDAARVADKIRRSVAEVEFKIYRDQDLTAQLTLSLGVAAGRIEDTAAKVFERADQASYLSKERGRDQVQTESSR